MILMLVPSSSLGKCQGMASARIQTGTEILPRCMDVLKKTFSVKIYNSSKSFDIYIDLSMDKT